MRPTIKLALAAAVCAPLVTDVASAGSASGLMPVFNTPVVTEDFLSDLNLKQLRIVRRATRLCPTLGRWIRADRDPCVIMSSDKAIGDTQNWNLIAFHIALPVTARYDLERSTNVWRVWLMDQ